MALKKFVLVVLLVVNVVMCRPSPRDSTAVIAKDQNVQGPETQIFEKAEASTPANKEPKVLIPGRVSCPHEEATEDSVCLDLCVPKGYSYGLCVSRTCSCV